MMLQAAFRHELQLFGKGLMFPGRCAHRRDGGEGSARKIASSSAASKDAGYAGQYGLCRRWRSYISKQAEMVGLGLLVFARKRSGEPS
jgi:hypothetical protein